jgi:hypothetical protein
MKLSEMGGYPGKRWLETNTLSMLRKEYCQDESNIDRMAEVDGLFRKIDEEVAR